MTFADRHISERLGDYAGRRRVIDGSDVDWVVARRREGLSQQHIATMGRLSLEDVNKICAQYLRGYQPAARPGFDPRATFSLSFSVVVDSAGNAPMKARTNLNLIGSYGLSHALVGREVRVRRPWRSLVEEVARKHGLTFEDLVGPYRSRCVAHPRHEAMWRLKQENRWSLPRIGQMLGNRDHTTVIHGIRSHEKRLAQAAADAAAKVAA